MIAVHHLYRLVTVAAIGVTVPALAQQLDGSTKVKAQVIIAACRSDAAMLCPGVMPGGGRILACLEEKAALASPACRSALPDAEALRASRQSR